MGLYFNPRNESFQKASRNPISIDKTELLTHLNKRIGGSDNCICVSRARRFGKTQAANMLDAYYSLANDSRESFSEFKISKDKDFLTHLNKYNVIHIDIASFMELYKDELVENICQILYREMKEEIPELIDSTNMICTVLLDAYQKSGTPFVIIIDEWDCVIRNHSDRPELVRQYMRFLHSLFKTEESKRFLALAYITGILPIKMIEDGSSLNNFVEYTMLKSKPLTQSFGFTEEEVIDLCKKYDIDVQTVKEWYGGYKIDGVSMYNPNSVYCAMMNHDCGFYWKNTSEIDTINKYITLNHEGLKDDILAMLAGEKIEVYTSSFRNDFSLIESKDEALTALIHLGYLGYDKERGLAYVPNYEVGLIFQRIMHGKDLSL